MKTLRLKNYLFYSGDQSISLYSFLNGLMLHGSKSRERTKFLKIINDRVLATEQERIKLASKHAKRNKHNEILYVGADGKETTNNTTGGSFVIENQEDFKKDLLSYLEEEFVIEISPTNNVTIYTVKELLLKCDKEFSGQEAVQYNEWCEAFENIKETL